MSNILTKEEYKKLVIDVAIRISPLLIEKKPDSLEAGQNIALYARDIAESVEAILKQPY